MCLSMVVLTMVLLLVMVLAHVCLHTLTPVLHEMLVFIEHVSL